MKNYKFGVMMKSLLLAGLIASPAVIADTIKLGAAVSLSGKSQQQVTILKKAMT